MKRSLGVLYADYEFVNMGFCRRAVPKDLVVESRELYRRVRARLYSQARYASTGTVRDRAHRVLVNKSISDIVAEWCSSLFPEFRLYYAGFAVKQPSGVLSDLPLHQDVTSVRFGDSVSSFVAWIPLWRVTRERGCMRVVPASHWQNRNPRSLDTPFAFASSINELEALCQHVEMEPGEVLLFEQALVHGSFGNFGDTERVAVVLLFAPRTEPIVTYLRRQEGEGCVLDEYEVSDSFLVELGCRGEPSASEWRRSVAEVLEPWSRSARTSELLNRRRRGVSSQDGNE